MNDSGPLELSFINPTGIFGPLLSSELSASIGLLKALLAGAFPLLPDMWFGAVDVRDVADLHLRAMTNPAAAGEGFIAVAVVFHMMSSGSGLATAGSLSKTRSSTITLPFRHGF